MVGERLKQFSQKIGITGYRLAKESGVSQQAVSNYFIGKGEPSVEILARIARTYPSLNIRWLLTGDGEMLEKGAAMEAAVSG